MRIHYIAVAISCLIVIASCEKKEEPLCGDPPPPSDIDSYSFVIRDSAGNNMLRDAPRRLHLSKLQITQACGAEFGRADESGYTTGTMRLFLATGPYNGRECNTAYLKWDDIDTDTLTYEYTTNVQRCFTRYEVTSFHFNGKVVQPDTANKTLTAGSRIYTLQK
jgi:hypothetical protein